MATYKLKRKLFVWNIGTNFANAFKNPNNLGMMSRIGEGAKGLAKTGAIAAGTTAVVGGGLGYTAYKATGADETKKAMDGSLF